MFGRYQGTGIHLETRQPCKKPYGAKAKQDSARVVGVRWLPILVDQQAQRPFPLWISDLEGGLERSGLVNFILDVTPS